MIGSTTLRRFVTVIGVVLSLVLGVGAIRVAAAWTASAAPLAVAPVSAAELQVRLTDERARSGSLAGQLEALDARSRDLATALEQAQTRISQDAAHADDLDRQLVTAKLRLAKLEAALSRAKQALRVTGSAGPPAAARTSGGGRGEHEGEGESHED
jgi:hypothetical protein